MVFDLSKPAVKAVKSSFGGGWVIPLNDDGRRVLAEYYGEPATEIPVLAQRGQRGFALGYIVEPQDASDLADYLYSEKIAWEIGS